MWKTWIIDSEDSATMLTLARRSSRRRRWFSASGEQALFPWPWGSVTAWTQTQGFPGNSGLAKFLGSFSLTPNNQICGTTRDEPKEHSGEKLLWHCLQQQCCWVPHRAWLQVINTTKYLERRLVITKVLSRLEYEYIAKGFIFRKGRIKVTVSRVGVTYLWFLAFSKWSF